MIGFALSDQRARRTAVIRRVVHSSRLQNFLTTALTDVLVAMEVQGTVPAGEPFAYYHGAVNGTLDVETGFPIVGKFVADGDVIPGELPAGRVMTGVHTGPYETLGVTYSEMISWASSDGLEPTGEMWEVHLTDPEREPNPDRWRTAVFLRVEQRTNRMAE